jgi:ADP-heptose:LPS heptosyltransferase
MSSGFKQCSGRILVIRGGAIGDFILTLPAIAALRQQFPGAYLEILGYPHIIQLATAGGLVDCARSIEARQLAGFFARAGELADDLQEYFAGFDLIISYLYDPDLIFRTNVARCTRAQFIAGPHRPDDRGKVHASKVFLKPLESLAIFDPDPVPSLRLGIGPLEAKGFPAWFPFREKAISHPSAPVLALHPGSGAERKNWPEPRWADLLERLMHATSFNLLLIGGEAEGERLQRLAAALPPTRTRVAQSLPLADLGALLSRCDGFVGHDSGISHLAAALGLPGLLLWSDSVEAVWRPPSRRIRLLRHPQGLKYLVVTDVFDEITRIWQAEVK